MVQRRRRIGPVLARDRLERARSRTPRVRANRAASRTPERAVLARARGRVLRVELLVGEDAAGDPEGQRATTGRRRESSYITPPMSRNTSGCRRRARRPRALPRGCGAHVGHGGEVDESTPSRSVTSRTRSDGGVTPSARRRGRRGASAWTRRRRARRRSGVDDIVHLDVARGGRPTRASVDSPRLARRSRARPACTVAGHVADVDRPGTGVKAAPPGRRREQAASNQGIRSTGGEDGAWRRTAGAAGRHRGARRRVRRGWPRCGTGSSCRRGRSRHEGGPPVGAGEQVGDAGQRPPCEARERPAVDGEAGRRGEHLLVDLEARRRRCRRRSPRRGRACAGPHRGR